ncbi:MAG: ABC transporter permease [Alphaproteobacteria bacterium]|nr:ABC transporter permease [Alphaproteobacteria bacterium]
MQINQQNNLNINLKNDVLDITLSGDALGCNVEQNLQNLISATKTTHVKSLTIQAKNLKNWDSSLLAFLYEVISLTKKQNISYDINNLPQNLQDLLNLALSVDRKPTRGNAEKYNFLGRIGQKTINLWHKITSALDFMGDVCEAIGRFCVFKSIMRKVDFWAALEDCGPKALGIVSLISFLVGLILAFVGAVQLETFGAQIYIASLVTIGMCRIMGAIMVGIIMAGRTGSSYAATIGTMQVNEELDALQTMGLSHIDFLVLPRLLALLIAMPILTMLADFMGMVGGAFVGVIIMGLPNVEYWKYAFEAFSLDNFLVGIFHGFCFGFIIALCGCYSGLTCGRNADSVGVATTRSVVNAIVWMIVATGIITIIFQELGI